MQDLPQRRQQTISRSVQVSGFGLFGGVDVTVEFCPAEPDHGIVFERVDLVNTPQVPALIEYVVPKPRCTVISHGDATVTVVEHVMAALYAAGVDHALLELWGPETPILDGSFQRYLAAVSETGTVELEAPDEVISVRGPLTV